MNPGMTPAYVRVLGVLVVASVMSASVCAQSSDQAETPGEITALRGDLYEVRVGDQHTVFLVARDGIILADPLTRAAALWLKRELDERFPGRPLRYVLVSHFQLERAEGVSALYQSAEVIGHRRFNGKLSEARRAKPEAHRFAHDVETVFDDRQIVKVADASVEMIHLGTERAPDLSVIYFARERVLFAVDPPAITTVPFAFGGWKPHEVFNWLQRVSALDFDIVVLGDGRRVTRADVIALRDYLETLKYTVAALYEDGYSLTAVERVAAVPAYANGPHYASRRDHAAVIYRSLHLFRVDGFAAGVASYTPRNPADYCTGYQSCSAGGALAAGSAGVAVSFNRGMGVNAEVTLGEQSWNSRLNPLFREEVAVRQSRASALFRYAPLSPRSRGYAVLGGLSFTSGDVKGADRVDGTLLPLGGRHVIADRSVRLGVTIGADLTQAIGRGTRLYVPLRATWFTNDPYDHWPGGFDLQVGAGVRFGLLRHVG